MSKRSASHSLFFVFVLAFVLPSARGQGDSGEFIIVSGGPALRMWEDLRVPRDRHDKWWGNFVRPARVRIQEIQKRYGPRAHVTWMVHKPSYSTRANEENKPHLSNILSVQRLTKCQLIWFSTGSEVIGYINNGRNRQREKVVNFEFFGHSNKYCLMFDYSNQVSGASKAWIHVRDIPRIHRNAFAQNAFCKSWGCHTGEAMSAAWKRHLGVSLIGAVGKTDYRWIGDGALPILSRGGKWAR